MHLYFQSVFEMAPYIFETSEVLHMLQAVQSCSALLCLELSFGKT